MPSNDALEQLLAEFGERELPRVTPRDIELPQVDGKADVLIGMRRSGKTYCLFQQIQKLEAAGIARSQMLYLNLEDDRLYPWSEGDLASMEEVFFRRFPDSRGAPCYFFLDEVQAAPGWERFTRRLIDGGDVSLFLTGSSAKLLSTEISTTLRGRSLATEVLPFSFAESLRHRAVDVPSRWPVSPSVASRLAHEFERYLDVGGFPEVQDVDADVRRQILQEYVNVVLLRDVVERHGVDSVGALRYLMNRLLSQPAGRFSAHRIYNDLKSQGFRIGKDRVYEYLDHLEDAYLLFEVPIASESLRVRQTNPRKAYPIDPALAASTSLKAQRDLGHRLENLVYLELRRRGWEVSYVKTESGYEVDFLAVRNGEPQLIQVCLDLSTDGVRQRELRALDEAMAQRQLDRGVAVTLNGRYEELKVDSGTVVSVPSWRWFLEGR